ncbi:MAG: glycerol-3-phosphate 1-O-acyltransferase PlsY [Bacteroidales bacterium]|nr:glycerol-3-phosphate 1-O-acyltransferase PlsY [Bacteroidales bacterium]
MTLNIVALLLAYLLGSIPASVWLGKWIRGIDLRKHGSGNAGATNAFRVLGKPIGVAVLVFDMLKGFLAVNISFLLDSVTSGSEGWMILRIVLGSLAVAGHIFPVFAGFRGGKGVATMAGVGLAIHPYAALAAVGVFLVIFLISRLSALASLSAALSYPVWIILVFQTEFRALWVFSILVPVLLIITHSSNISRLIRGAEKPILKNES